MSLEKRGIGRSGGTFKTCSDAGQGSGTLAEDIPDSLFWVVHVHQRLLASPSCAEGGQVWCQEKEEIIGLQKNIGCARSKTGQRTPTEVSAGVGIEGLIHFEQAALHSGLPQ